VSTYRLAFLAEIKWFLILRACAARSVGAWATFLAPVPGGGTGLGIAGLWWGLGAGLFSTCSCGAFLLSRTDWAELAAKISRSRSAVGSTDCAGESQPAPSLDRFCRHLT
jgi:hypothetical protein